MTPLPATEQDIPMITENQTERMMQYLRNCNDSSITATRRSTTAEEAEVAIALLSIPLRGGDWDTNRRVNFADSNYRPDVALRNEAFEECGLTDLDITRHDIILHSGPNQLAVKVINITKVVGKGEEQKTVDVPGGILLLGKIVFRGGSNATYEELTADEFARVKAFVETHRPA
ncbi:hypothetical protein H7X65_02105 [Candidatus Parcubacteria bacterium]|nr:hypothetical protein [Candidatus Parcubacteria bacterium]